MVGRNSQQQLQREVVTERHREEETSGGDRTYRTNDKTNFEFGINRNKGVDVLWNIVPPQCSSSILEYRTKYPPKLVSPSGFVVFLGPSGTEAGAGGATSVWAGELLVSDGLAGGAAIGLVPGAEDEELGLADSGGGLGEACLGGGVFGSGGGDGVWAGAGAESAAGAGAAAGCDMAGTGSEPPTESEMSARCQQGD